MIEAVIEELKALIEIYKNLKFKINDDGDELDIYFDAELNLNEPGDVVIRHKADLLRVSHLPPLSVHLRATSGGGDMQLSFQCNWLSVALIGKLRARTESIIAGCADGVLWNCFQFIENESLALLFGSPAPGDDLVIDTDALATEADAGGELYGILRDYNSRKLQSVFSSSIITCAICTVSKRGCHCIELSNCRHTFCIECAADYYNVLIKTGVLELTCLICDCKLQYDEIKCLLATEEFERWDKLLLNQFLKQGSGSRVCPRCQISVITDDDDYGMCSQCGFVFCVVCGKTYHGPGDCDEATRRLMLEEENRLKKTTLRCPVCKEGYEKTGGCNKMICSNCRAFFCYICNMVLDNDNPYAHFGLAPKCFL